jgi:starch phosphorylase
VKFYGKIIQSTDSNGWINYNWIDTDDVMAIAYDVPVPGYLNNTVNNLRLWSAKAGEDFNLDYFNHGDYERAVKDKIDSEVISKVLYPRDDYKQGRELRLKQEYFLSSATLQDIMRRYKKAHDSFDTFPKKVAIQLNDTHPVLSIPELMHILIDKERLPWEKAWDITTRTFAFTNHTVLQEALESWRVNLMERLLPRHLQIIYEINRRFLDKIQMHYPRELDRLQRMSIIEEGPQKSVRMANLAIIGSHSVNGVAQLHTDILRTQLFKDFNAYWPEKFNCKTNGITQRRWLKLCNPSLSNLISETIGDEWVLDLFALKKLNQHLDDAGLIKKWQKAKQDNKKNLADYIQSQNNFKVNVDSIFDCQIKRIHEYKRQLLNILHSIALYLRLKNGAAGQEVARTFIFAGKAAPAYLRAKLIIKLINAVAEVVNKDPDVRDRLKIIFIPDYSVSIAQKIIPAADLSEQISTAGMEASGTGNMKFALNGALTIGTLDGANIEIKKEVGDDNIFIFGLTAEEVIRSRQNGYEPYQIYSENEELKAVIDLINSNYFSRSEPDIFRPIIDDLLNQDYFRVMADYDGYVQTQRKVSDLYRNRDLWTRKSIINTSHMGQFSSDRTIHQYAEEIWQAKKTAIQMLKEK